MNGQKGKVDYRQRVPEDTIKGFVLGTHYTTYYWNVPE
jgi:hypothetical protein